MQATLKPLIVPINSMARHDISSSDPCIRGGLAGSWPVWAPYGKFRILNWATKFLSDALLLRIKG